MSLAFAAGRYSVSQKTISTKEGIISDDKKKEDAETHTVTHTVTVVKPDGNSVTTTDTQTNISDKQIDTDDTKTSISQVTSIAARSTINISALAGVNANNLSQVPIYGISISKEVLGPITAGLYGLNNGILGVSIGVNF